jgi:hypothetical protein
MWRSGPRSLKGAECVALHLTSGGRPLDSVVAPNPFVRRAPEGRASLAEDGAEHLPSTIRVPPTAWSSRSSIGS